MRYEPWVHPAALARSLHDTIYRGRSGENSWSPDVLIEVLEKATDRLSLTRVEYAIVIDAKYTSRITGRHQDGVRKYNEIRRTDDNRPVVKQVWLAYPSDVGITPWDEAVEWTDVGPDRPRSEDINGALGVMPPVAPAMAAGDSPVNETLLEFVKGTLAYLDIVDGTKQRLAS